MFKISAVGLTAIYFHVPVLGLWIRLLRILWASSHCLTRYFIRSLHFRKCEKSFGKRRRSCWGVSRWAHLKNKEQRILIINNTSESSKQFKGEIAWFFYCIFFNKDKRNSIRNQTCCKCIWNKLTINLQIIIRENKVTWDYTIHQCNKLN